MNFEKQYLRFDKACMKRFGFHVCFDGFSGDIPFDGESRLIAHVTIYPRKKAAQIVLIAIKEFTFGWWTAKKFPPTEVIIRDSNQLF